MSISGALANQIISKMTEKLLIKEQELAERRLEIYEKIPEIHDIDRKLRMSLSCAARNAFESNIDALHEMEKIRHENLSLQRRKKEILIANGYYPEYLMLKYDCMLCGDSGYIGSKICTCVEEQAIKLKTSELSNMLDIKNQNFELFDFTYYSAVPDNRLNISPRQNMEYNFDKCVDFARTFGVHKENLLLFGAPGLGKTFLSTAIAKEVSERGFSVTYDTISSILECYERDKFSNDLKARDKIQTFYACDLLIIDDLGSEMSTSFTLSAVYSLINRRLMDEKCMIINTNLNIGDFSRRYNEAVASRLDGSFTHLRFFGEDIRRLKKMRR